MDANTIKLSFETYMIDENKIWFPAFDHNGLYFQDQTEKEAVLAGIIPNEEKYMIRLFSSMQKWKNRIFLIPFAAQNISIYDTVRNEFQQIPLRTINDFGEKKHANELAKFWCSELYDNYLFLFPHNYPALVIIHAETLEIEYIYDFIDDLEKQAINGEPYITDICVENGTAYCSCGCANVVIQIELRERNIKFYEIPGAVNGTNGILKIQNEIWLAPRIKGGILCFDQKKNKVSIYDQYPDGFQSKHLPFHTLFKCSNGIVLIPDLSEDFILLDAQSGKMCSMQYLSDFISGKFEKYAYSIDKTMAYGIKGDTISFMSGKDYNFYIVNLATHDVKKYEFFITNIYPEIGMIPFSKCNFEHNHVFAENQTYRLRSYLSYITNTNYVKKELLCTTNIKGEKIYHALKPCT